MEERSKVRIIRYVIGVVALLLGLFFMYLLENFEIIFSSLHYGIKIFIMLVLILGIVSSMVWSAILIGRCEAFLNKNYPKVK